MILSKIDNKEIGLKLFSSSVEPPLCSGITFATFKTSGKMPVEKEALIIRQSGMTIISATIFNSLRGILAGPVPLFGKVFMISSISFSDIWAIIKSILHFRLYC